MSKPEKNFLDFLRRGKKNDAPAPADVPVPTPQTLPEVPRRSPGGSSLIGRRERNEAEAAGTAFVTPAPPSVPAVPAFGVTGPVPASGPVQTATLGQVSPDFKHLGSPLDQGGRSPIALAPSPSLHPPTPETPDPLDTGIHLLDTGEPPVPSPGLQTPHQPAPPSIRPVTAELALHGEPQPLAGGRIKRTLAIRGTDIGGRPYLLTGHETEQVTPEGRRFDLMLTESEAYDLRAGHTPRTDRAPVRLRLDQVPGEALARLAQVSGDPALLTRLGLQEQETPLR